MNPKHTKLVNYSKGHQFSEASLIHLRDCVTTLGDLWRSPISSLLTMMVIGLALSLPLIFLVLLNNASQISDNLSGHAQISVFLKTTISEEKRHTLEKQFEENAGISKVQAISPTEALMELNAALDIQNASSVLSQNPLPWVLVLTLNPLKHFSQTTSGSLEAEKLLDEIRALPEVEMASLDLQWLKRFMGALVLVKQLVVGMSVLLALAVLFVIGNTLRLNIENQRENIEVLKLVGATDGFVRRPFLYLGMWTGGFGAFIALLIIVGFIGWVRHAAKEFFALYDSSFQLLGPDTATILTLLGLGVLLGFGGAWLAVSRFLRSTSAY